MSRSSAIFPHRNTWLAYLVYVNPNPEILARILESFSSVDIDDIEMVSAKTFPFSPALDGAEEYVSQQVAPETLIVCFESIAELPEHVESFFFRREDLFNGEVIGSGLLIAEELSSGPKRLMFFVGDEPAALV